MVVVPISTKITGEESVIFSNAGSEKERILVSLLTSPKHLPQPVQIVHLFPVFIPVYDITTDPFRGII